MCTQWNNSSQIYDGELLRNNSQKQRSSHRVRIVRAQEKNVLYIGLMENE